MIIWRFYVTNMSFSLIYKPLHIGSVYSMDKIMSIDGDNFINSTFSRVSEMGERVTRSSIRNELHIPKYRLEVTGGNIRVRGSRYYNKLPMTTREKPT